jgi:hypothetical protein
MRLPGTAAWKDNPWLAPVTGWGEYDDQTRLLESNKVPAGDNWRSFVALDWGTPVYFNDLVVATICLFFNESPATTGPEWAALLLTDAP